METTLTAFLLYSAHVYMYINLIFTVFSSTKKLKKLLIMKNEVKKKKAIHSTQSVLSAKYLDNE